MRTRLSQLAARSLGVVAIVLVLGVGARTGEAPGVPNPIVGFGIQLGTTGLSNANKYELNIEGKRKFSLVVTSLFTDDDRLPQTFQIGEKFETATVQVFNNQLTVLITYSLGDVLVESVQYGSNASGHLVQTLHLSAKSLGTTP